MNKLSVIAVFTLLLGCALPAGAQPEFPPSRPNIILIVAKDLGRGDLSSYGQTKFKTPNIDRLAAEGLRYEQFYAGGTASVVAHAALLTGLHSGHLPVRGGRSEHFTGNTSGRVPLTGADLTLPRYVSRFNYQSAAFGLWTLGEEYTTGEPKQQYIKQWMGYYSEREADDIFPERLWRWDHWTDYNGRATVYGNLGGKNSSYILDHLSLITKKFIVAYEDYPQFVYLPLPVLHATAGEEGVVVVPDDVPYTVEDWPQPERNKAAAISRVDKFVGEIYDEVHLRGMAHRTIIVFTSDGGPTERGGVDPEFFDSAGGLRGVKGDLTEGGLRVPFIVWWPGRADAGVVVEEPWAHWDLFPSLMEAVNLKVPEDLDGISMLPTWLDQNQTNRHESFYFESHERDGFAQAVRLNDWKAIRPSLEEPVELYDLKQGPGEEKDVAEENPEVVARMEELMVSSRTPNGWWPTDLDEESAKAAEEAGEANAENDPVRNFGLPPAE